MSRRSHYSFLRDMGKNWGKSHAEIHLWKGQSKLHKFWLTTLGVAMVVGVTRYMFILNRAREVARARIEYHPLHGYMGTQSDYLAANRLMITWLITIAVVVMIGVAMAVYKRYRHRGNQQWAAIAHAARQAKSVTAN